MPKTCKPSRPEVFQYNPIQPLKMPHITVMFKESKGGQHGSKNIHTKTCDLLDNTSSKNKSVGSYIGSFCVNTRNKCHNCLNNRGNKHIST